jgi:hypothetical protein
MITASTWEGRELLGNQPWACLLIDSLFHYRGRTYLLQVIKGDFPHGVKKELGSNIEVWQKGFSHRRIRDARNFDVPVAYIRQNPVRRRWCEPSADYAYSPICGGFEWDKVARRLKPVASAAAVGAPEGEPSQGNRKRSDFKPNNIEYSPAESRYSRNTRPCQGSPPA